MSNSSLPLTFRARPQSDPSGTILSYLQSLSEWYVEGMDQDANNFWNEVVFASPTSLYNFLSFFLNLCELENGIGSFVFGNVTLVGVSRTGERSSSPASHTSFESNAEDNIVSAIDFVRQLRTNDPSRFDVNHILLHFQIGAVSRSSSKSEAVGDEDEQRIWFRRIGRTNGNEGKTMCDNLQFLITKLVPTSPRSGAIGINESQSILRALLHSSGITERLEEYQSENETVMECLRLTSKQVAWIAETVKRFSLVRGVECKADDVGRQIRRWLGSRKYTREEQDIEDCGSMSGHGDYGSVDANSTGALFRKEQAKIDAMWGAYIIKCREKSEAVVNFERRVRAPSVTRIRELRMDSNKESVTASKVTLFVDEKSVAADDLANFSFVVNGQQGRDNKDEEEEDVEEETKKKNRTDNASAATPHPTAHTGTPHPTTHTGTPGATHIYAPRTIGSSENRNKNRSKFRRDKVVSGGGAALADQIEAAAAAAAVEGGNKKSDVFEFTDSDESDKEEMGKVPEEEEEEGFVEEEENIVEEEKREEDIENEEEKQVVEGEQQISNSNQSTSISSTATVHVAQQQQQPQNKGDSGDRGGGGNGSIDDGPPTVGVFSGLRMLILSETMEPRVDTRMSCLIIENGGIVTWTDNCDETITHVLAALSHSELQRWMHFRYQRFARAHSVTMEVARTRLQPAFCNPEWVETCVRARRQLPVKRVDNVNSQSDNVNSQSDRLARVASVNADIEASRTQAAAVSQPVLIGTGSFVRSSGPAVVQVPPRQLTQQEKLQTRAQMRVLPVTETQPQTQIQAQQRHAQHAHTYTHEQVQPQTHTRQVHAHAHQASAQHAHAYTHSQAQHRAHIQQSYTQRTNAHTYTQEQEERRTQTQQAHTYQSHIQQGITEVVAPSASYQRDVDYHLAHLQTSLAGGREPTPAEKMAHLQRCMQLGDLNINSTTTAEQHHLRITALQNSNGSIGDRNRSIGPPLSAGVGDNESIYSYDPHVGNGTISNPNANSTFQGLFVMILNEGMDASAEARMKQLITANGGTVTNECDGTTTHVLSTWETDRLGPWLDEATQRFARAQNISIEVAMDQILPDFCKPEWVDACVQQGQAIRVTGGTEESVVDETDEEDLGSPSMGDTSPQTENVNSSEIDNVNSSETDNVNSQSTGHVISQNTGYTNTSQTGNDVIDISFSDSEEEKEDDTDSSSVDFAVSSQSGCIGSIGTGVGNRNIGGDIGTPTGVDGNGARNGSINGSIDGSFEGGTCNGEGVSSAEWMSSVSSEGEACKEPGCPSSARLQSKYCIDHTKSAYRLRHDLNYTKACKRDSEKGLPIPSSKPYTKGKKIKKSAGNGSIDDAGGNGSTVNTSGYGSINDTAGNGSVDHTAGNKSIGRDSGGNRSSDDVALATIISKPSKKNKTEKAGHVVADCIAAGKDPTLYRVFKAHMMRTRPAMKLWSIKSMWRDMNDTKRGVYKKFIGDVAAGGNGSIGNSDGNGSIDRSGGSSIGIGTSADIGSIGVSRGADNVDIAGDGSIGDTGDGSIGVVSAHAQRLAQLFAANPSAVDRVQAQLSQLAAAEASPVRASLSTNATNRLSRLAADAAAPQAPVTVVNTSDNNRHIGAGGNGPIVPDIGNRSIGNGSIGSGAVGHHVYTGGTKFYVLDPNGNVQVIPFGANSSCRYDVIFQIECLKYAIDRRKPTVDEMKTWLHCCIRSRRMDLTSTTTKDQHSKRMRSSRMYTSGNLAQAPGHIFRNLHFLFLAEGMHADSLNVLKTHITSRSNDGSITSQFNMATTHVVSTWTDEELQLWLRRSRELFTQDMNVTMEVAERMLKPEFVNPNWLTECLRRGRLLLIPANTIEYSSARQKAVAGAHRGQDGTVVAGQRTVAAAQQDQQQQQQQQQQQPLSNTAIQMPSTILAKHADARLQRLCLMRSRQDKIEGQQAPSTKRARCGPSSARTNTPNSTASSSKRPSDTVVDRTGARKRTDSNPSRPANSSGNMPDISATSSKHLSNAVTGSTESSKRTDPNRSQLTNESGNDTGRLVSTSNQPILIDLDSSDDERFVKKVKKNKSKGIDDRTASFERPAVANSKRSSESEKSADKVVASKKRKKSTSKSTDLLSIESNADNDSVNARKIKKQKLEKNKNNKNKEKPKATIKTQVNDSSDSSDSSDDAVEFSSKKKKRIKKKNKNNDTAKSKRKPQEGDVIDDDVNSDDAIRTKKKKDTAKSKRKPQDDDVIGDNINSDDVSKKKHKNMKTNAVASTLVTENKKITKKTLDNDDGASVSPFQKWNKAAQRARIAKVAAATPPRSGLKKKTKVNENTGASSSASSPAKSKKKLKAKKDNQQEEKQKAYVHTFLHNKQGETAICDEVVDGEALQVAIIRKYFHLHKLTQEYVKTNWNSLFPKVKKFSEKEYTFNLTGSASSFWDELEKIISAWNGWNFGGARSRRVSRNATGDLSERVKRTPVPTLSKELKDKAESLPMDVFVWHRLIQAHHYFKLSNINTQTTDAVSNQTYKDVDQLAIRIAKEAKELGIPIKGKKNVRQWIMKFAAKSIGLERGFAQLITPSIGPADAFVREQYGLTPSHGRKYDKKVEKLIREMDACAEDVILDLLNAYQVLAYTQ